MYESIYHTDFLNICDRKVKKKNEKCKNVYFMDRDSNQRPLVLANNNIHFKIT